MASKEKGGLLASNRFMCIALVLNDDKGLTTFSVLFVILWREVQFGGTNTGLPSWPYWGMWRPPKCLQLTPHHQLSRPSILEGWYRYDSVPLPQFHSNRPAAWILGPSPQRVKYLWLELYLLDFELDPLSRLSDFVQWADNGAQISPRREVRGFVVLKRTVSPPTSTVKNNNSRSTKLLKVNSVCFQDHIHHSILPTTTPHAKSTSTSPGLRQVHIHSTTINSTST